MLDEIKKSLEDLIYSYTNDGRFNKLMQDSNNLLKKMNLGTISRKEFLKDHINFLEKYKSWHEGCRKTLQVDNEKEIGNLKKSIKSMKEELSECED